MPERMPLAPMDLLLLAAIKAAQSNPNVGDVDLHGQALGDNAKARLHRAGLIRHERTGWIVTARGARMLRDLKTAMRENRHG